jgi:hypothetical protein
LLVASREDIDSSTAWNQRLLNVLPEAFVSGVLELIKGPLRYTWMRYLPERPPLSDLFERFESEVLQLLSFEAVAESMAGHVTVPTDLRMVPDLFCETSHKPLIRSNKTKTHYLSSRYTRTDSQWLQRIGVQALSPREFLQDLISILSEKPAMLKEMPAEWHRRLCRALIFLINNDRTMKFEISRLPIIPLQDGQWISANRGNICFPNEAQKEDGWTVPEGVGIFEIDRTTSKDHFRQTLYNMLGVREFSKDLVCDAIIKILERPQYDPGTGMPKTCASLVTFLYKSNWKNNQDHKLWLVTDELKHAHSCHIYLDHSNALSATVFFLRGRERVYFLHRKYADYLPDDDGFQKWMVDNLKLACFPRLVQYTSQLNFQISSDFEVIWETAPLVKILLLLRDKWEYYSQWLLSDGETIDVAVEESKAKLRAIISDKRFECRGGKVARLKDTVLPLGGSFPDQIESLFLLDVPDPQDPRWKYLSCFGVVIEAGVGPIIQCLRHIRDSEVGSPEQVAELYRLVQGQSNSHGEIIR